MRDKVIMQSKFRPTRLDYDVYMMSIIFVLHVIKNI